MGEVADRDGGEGQGADPLWDDRETPPRVPSSPELHLDGFDGPLDLLLDLVERKRIDLRRVSPLAMVEQFAEAMERYAAHVALERRADWLVMAARLVLLRSRLCFPASPEDQQAAEREVRDTRRQLDELRTLRAAAAWLDARPQLGRDVFARPAGVNPRVSSYMDLMEACLAVLLREEELEQQPDQGRSTTLTLSRSSLYPIAAVICRYVCSFRRLRPSSGWSVSSRLSIEEPPTKTSPPVCAFATLVAALELARVGEVMLSQEQGQSGSEPIFVQSQSASGT